MGHASKHHAGVCAKGSNQDEPPPVGEQRVWKKEVPAAEDQHVEEHHDAVQPVPEQDRRAEAGEERQPDSNASAPQNFAPHYNSTQNYPARSSNDRPGQNFGRSGDRGGDGGRGGRWGRRGGRHRGGRPQGAPGGRNLPPSKYASPQAGESRGDDKRGGHPP